MTPELSTAELSRVVSVDRLPAGLVIEATPAECAALAGRLHIAEVRALTCRWVLRRQGVIVEAQGALEADVVQSCVVSLEPVEQHVSDRFVVRFVPEGADGEDGDPDAPDELPYRGSSIDLGEAASEQLALALDPYPRRGDAELDPAALDPGGGVFGGLAALRREP